MKAIFNLIRVAIIFLLIGGVFFLLINETFINEVFKTEAMDGDGISINRFMYLVPSDNKNEAVFYTPISFSKLENKKKSYLSSLESCYGIYYYDKDNDITITKYDIDNNKYLKKVYISYSSGNYCSGDYKLTDMWVYEYINLSSFISGDITEKAMNGLIDTIYKSKKEDNPVISNYKKTISINVLCSNNKEDYNLYFEDFSDNQLIVKKEEKGVVKFAVYDIENVKDLLNSLEKNK